MARPPNPSHSHAQGRSAANHVTHPTCSPPIGRYTPNAFLLPPIMRSCTNGRRRIHPPHRRAPHRFKSRGTATASRTSDGARRKMVRSAVVAVALAVALAAILLHPAAVAAGQKKATAARREDIPYIRCQVCERIAREISAEVAKKQRALPPAKKVPEIEIIEIAENVCNLKKQEADWMLRIDIVEKGDKLELVEQDEEGHCNSECKTIERACQEVMGYADTDVAEFVYKNRPSVDQLVKFLCKDLSEACAVDPPPVPKDRVPGEPFAAKPSKDAEMEKILRSMEGIPGAPSMKMYSRDDLMKNNFDSEEADEDEDDDEDEEDNFPKNLGKVRKDKGPQKKDLKQEVVKQIKDTGKKLKGHVNKVSKVVKKWWQGKKKPTKSGKTEL